MRERTSSPANALYSAAGTPFPRHPQPQSPTCSALARGSRRDRRRVRAPVSKRAATSTCFMRLGNSVGSSADCTRCANRISFSRRSSFVRIVFVEARVLDGDGCLAGEQRQNFYVTLLNASSSGLSRSNTPMQRSFSSNGMTSSIAHRQPARCTADPATRQAPAPAACAARRSQSGRVRS